MKIRVLLKMLAVWQVTLGQIPANDPSWVLKKQDDFTTFNSTDWNKHYWGTPINNGLEYNAESNVSCIGGYLEIKAEKLTTPIQYNGTDYYYKSGVAYSTFTYKYGYFEMSAKLPAGANGKGYWPAFWVFGGGPSSSCTVAPNDGEYNEIDIAENGGLESVTGTTLGIHYHWRNFTDCHRYWDWDNLSIENLPDLTLEHKYAIMWEPDRMTWYFDDQPIRTVYDPTYTPHNAINTIINFAIDPDPLRMPDASTAFPAYFRINYLKIHQLATDCNNPLSICTFNPATYTYKLQKSISVDGSGCNTVINTSNNVTLRATDFILLDVGTTITDNGSGSFSAIVTPCTN